MTIPNHIKYAPKILQRYFFYRRSQHWTRQQIEEYQDQKLIEIVRYAGKYVPYYRDLFKSINLDLQGFRGRSDMHLIPLLDKEVLRARSKEFVSDTAHHFDNQTAKTSGSTGTPLSLLLDEYSRYNKTAAVLRAYFWAGYKPGGRVFMLIGLSESKEKDYGFDPLRNTIYLNSSRINKENSVNTARLIARLKPSIYEGYARSYIDFHQYIEGEVKLPKPNGFLTYGETITPQIRKFIETACGCHLYDYYSHVENAAMICEAPDYHKYMMDDYFYPELVDTDGSLVQGNYGELVGTSFYNYSMPLIRYKTKDMVAIAQREESHKYAFTPVDFIEGRMDDYILLPDGRKIYFAEGALGYAKGVVAAQYVQDAPDHLTVNMIVDDEFSTEYYPEIEKGLIKRIGDTLRYSFNLVIELEKNASGKTPFIIRKI